MSLNVDALRAEVARVSLVQESAVKLLKELAKELEAVSAELAAKNSAAVPPIDTTALDELVTKLKDSTDSLAGAVADSWDTKASKEVILHADDPSKPTVAVIMPEVLPENVEVTVEKVETVDAASAEPQITIVVEEAKVPVELDAPVVSDVIPTAEGLVDVVVTAPEAAVEEAKAEGVDVMEEIKAAYESTEEITAEPLPKE